MQVGRAGRSGADRRRSRHRRQPDDDRRRRSSDGQGASVELVREIGAGHADLAVDAVGAVDAARRRTRTPTSAASPASSPARPTSCRCPKLVLDAARRLAAAPSPDRHLVVVAGTTFPAGPALDELTRVVDDARDPRPRRGAPPDVDAGAIVDLATRSGGLSPVLPTPVGEIDAVTRAIRDRFRATATVDGPGVHDVTLTLGDRTYTTALDIAAPAVAPPTAGHRAVADQRSEPGGAAGDASHHGGRCARPAVRGHHDRAVVRRLGVVGRDGPRGAGAPRRAARPRRRRGVRRVVRDAPARRARRRRATGRAGARRRARTGRRCRRPRSPRSARRRRAPGWTASAGSGRRARRAAPTRRRSTASPRRRAGRRRWRDWRPRRAASRMLGAPRRPVWASELAELQAGRRATRPTPRTPAASPRSWRSSRSTRPSSPPWQRARRSSPRRPHGSPRRPGSSRWRASRRKRAWRPRRRSSRRSGTASRRWPSRPRSARRDEDARVAAERAHLDELIRRAADDRAAKDEQFEAERTRLDGSRACSPDPNRSRASTPSRPSWTPRCLPRRSAGPSRRRASRRRRPAAPW